jgi:DNA-binding response OmpR family regulator
MTRAQDTFEKILVVDDSPAIRTLAELVLRQAGYDVSTVTTGADAMEWIKAEQPEVVLLDLSLPDMDGGEVCRLLKSDGSLQKIRLLMLLKTNETKRQKDLKALGADGFVVKPFTPEELVDQVELLAKKSRIDTDGQGVSGGKEPESESTSTRPHTYEWFVSEMKKEAEEDSSHTSSEEGSPAAEKDRPEENEAEYETSEVVTRRDSYENFISQFKEETKVEDTRAPLVYSELKIDEEKEPTSKIDTLKQEPSVKQQGKEIALDPERVTKELIHEVASRVAQEIVENLDKEGLRNLIRRKIEEFGV